MHLGLVPRLPVVVLVILADIYLATKLVEHVRIALAAATVVQMLLTIQILMLSAVVRLAVVIVAQGLALTLQLVLLVLHLEMFAPQLIIGATDLGTAQNRATTPLPHV